MNYDELKKVFQGVSNVSLEPYWMEIHPEVIRYANDELGMTPEELVQAIEEHCSPEETDEQGAE
jgi:hypothetical protein